MMRVIYAVAFAAIVALSVAFVADSMIVLKHAAVISPAREMAAALTFAVWYLSRPRRTP